MLSRQSLIPLLSTLQLPTPRDPAIEAHFSLKTLSLARAVRESVIASERAACLRIKELEITLEIAHFELEDMRRRLKEAEEQVEEVERSIEARGIRRHPLTTADVEPPNSFRYASPSESMSSASMRS